MAHVLVELHRIRGDLRAEITRMDNPCGLVDIEQRLSDLIEVETVRRCPLPGTVRVSIAAVLGRVDDHEEPNVFVNVYPTEHPR